MNTTASNREGPGAHVAGLLPAYANGTLVSAGVARVDAHCARCAACRADLALWQAVAAAAPAALTPPAGAEPAAQLSGRVWAAIAAATENPGPARRRAGRRAAYLRDFLRHQARLLPRGIWLACGPALLVGCLIAVVLSNRAGWPPLLGLIPPLVTAASAAVIYGPETDPALEIALATPAPPRLVLLTRLALVFGYNFGLALGVTLLLAWLGGGDFAPLAALWLGPMLLLTGLSLLLSLLASTLVGLATAIGLGGLHLLNLLLQMDSGDPAGGLAAVNAVWQTTPLILLCAAVLLGLAVFSVPHRVRLA